jgi:hypothetical protein
MRALYTVVEHFKNKDAAPAYRRFRDCGRIGPRGLGLRSELVDFEVHAGLTSQNAARKIPAPIGRLTIALTIGLQVGNLPPVLGPG